MALPRYFGQWLIQQLVLPYSQWWRRLKQAALSEIVSEMFVADKDCGVAWLTSPSFDSSLRENDWIVLFCYQFSKGKEIVFYEAVPQDLATVSFQNAKIFRVLIATIFLFAAIFWMFYRGSLVVGWKLLVLLLLGTVCRLWFLEAFRCALRPLREITRHCRRGVPDCGWRYQGNEAVQQCAIGWSVTNYSVSRWNEPLNILY